MKWASIEFAFNSLFRFSIKLLLAKLLSPNDFGLVGMASVFIAVATAASELGMGAALIQKKENEDAEKLFDTAFWSGLLWGVLVFTFICFVISPLASDFYDELILLKLIPALSIGILISPLNLVHTVILTRSMNFKKIAVINNTAALFGGVAGLVTAYLGWGLWALVLSNALTMVIPIPLLFLSTRWKPKFVWIKSHFRTIFGFGVYSTGTSIFSRLTYNVDNLLIGKLLGSNALGAYTLSFSLTENLRQTVSSILNKVMYPVFGKNQNNNEKLKDYFLTIVKINSLTLYPIMSILCLFSEPIVLFFFGPKWIDSILPLQILSIAVMIHLVINSFTSLLRGMGYPAMEFKIISILTVFVLIPSLYIFTTFWGLFGASCAILLNKVVLVIVSLVILKKYISLKPIEIFKATKPAIFSVILASSLHYLLASFSNHLNLFIQIASFLLMYLISIYYLDYKFIIQIYKKFRLSTVSTKIHN
jgi:teichuronic acid exporter